MNAEELDQLFARYVDGKCTPEEIEQVEALVEAYDNKSTAWQELQETGQKAWLATLWAEIKNSIYVYDRSVFSLHNRFKLSKLAVAAAAILVLVFGAYLIDTFWLENIRQADLISASKALPPGKNRATLTLPSGETIQLSNAKTGLVVDGSALAYNDGSKLSDPAASNRITTPGAGSSASLLLASTPRGGTYQVTLSDGTRIWLNAASSISFPAAFTGKERRINVRGEAYLEVAKDNLRPFIVESKGQQIQVLGTHFNINSYMDEGGVKTTLIEGSIKVSSAGRQAILKPGKQSICTATEIKIQQADTEEALGWKNGTFIFKQQRIAEIMKNIARWYDVEVVFDDDFDDQETFSGQVSRSSQISEILKSLQSSGKVKFNIEGKTIHVNY